MEALTFPEGEFFINIFIYYTSYRILGLWLVSYRPPILNSMPVFGRMVLLPGTILACLVFLFVNRWRVSPLISSSEISRLIQWLTVTGNPSQQSIHSHCEAKSRPGASDSPRLGEIWWDLRVAILSLVFGLQFKWTSCTFKHVKNDFTFRRGSTTWTSWARRYELLLTLL